MFSADVCVDVTRKCISTIQSNVVTSIRLCLENLSIMEARLAVHDEVGIWVCCENCTIH